jgi:hypothetical protein
MDLSLPVGPILKTVDAARSLADEAAGRQLSTDEKRKIFEAAVNLALDAPGPAPHVGLAYTAVDRLEIGLRYAGGAARGGVRYQVLSRETSFADLSVGVGVSRYTYQFPVPDVIKVLEVDDLVRWQLDVPVLIGTSGDWYRVWGGPKLLYSTYRTAARLALPGAEIELASARGTALYVGAQGGVALGYKHVFVGVELTLAQLFGGADLEALGQQTRVDTGSFIVYPGVGLLAEF